MYHIYFKVDIEYYRYINKIEAFRDFTTKIHNYLHTKLINVN